MKTEQWHKERQAGIGGSDAAVILGISPWKTRLALWKEKRGEIEREPETELMYWGLRLEPIIAEEYTRRSGDALYRPDGICRHASYEWMQCNPDFFVAGKPDVLIEVKNVSAYVAHEWGAEGSDYIPAYYKAQGQHNMAATGRQVCIFPILIGGNTFKYYVLPRDDNFIDNVLLPAEIAFRKAVVDGTAPKPVNADDIALLYPAATPHKVRTASRRIVRAWGKLCALKKKYTLCETKIETLKMRIQQFMGDASELEFNGVTLAKWGGKVRRQFRVTMPDDLVAEQADYNGDK